MAAAWKWPFEMREEIEVSCLGACVEVRKGWGIMFGGRGR